MRFGIIKIALVLIFVCAAAAAGVNAQRAEVKIDFDFRIGKHVYPAGVYNITEVNPSSPGVLRFGAEGHGASGLAVAQRFESISPSQSKLVFERFGETYYLTELFLAPSHRGYAFSIPKGRSNGRVAIAVMNEKPNSKGN